MKPYITLSIFLISFGLNAQELDKIEPPSWWKGMKLDTVEFMVYGSDIHELEAQSKTLNVIKSEALSSPNYLFVTVHVPLNIIEGQHKLTFTNTKGKRVGSLLVEIQERRPQSSEREGFSSKDNIYLIMPDRFCNGNAANDNLKGMLETTNRSFKGGRHGGDLEGIEKNLDYFKEIGMTALWLNPVLENNMPEYSYHGYAMTDLYNVDSRFGSNEEYQHLCASAKQMGIGIIMDQVANHIGSYHPWMADLPSDDWVNQWEEFTQTNHMKVSRFDPHAAAIDQRVFHNGWFVSTMPDLNQCNSKLANYLLQNSIWWIEYADLYGIRMDTWSYPDKEFLANWTKGILDEYPNFNIVGEEWVSDPSLISYWQSNTIRGDGYKSYLPSIMDFPLQSSIIEGLKGKTGWRSSMTKIYESLANDYMYNNHNNIMIFPDNHDMSRIYTQLDEDFDLWKMAMSIYFTMRGTLQIFYGTEILMSNGETSDHGIIRSDFPGGWAGDDVNAFNGNGLSTQQLEGLEWFKKLSHLRKNSLALNSGELLHYIPLNEVYVYFRLYERERIMVIANRNNSGKSIEIDRYSQGLQESIYAENLITGETINLSNGILEVGPLETLILSLSK